VKLGGSTFAPDEGGGVSNGVEDVFVESEIIMMFR
jgi:hypothetical protein